MDDLDDYDDVVIPFYGWSTESDPTKFRTNSAELFDFDSFLTEDLSLYAVFKLDRTFTAASCGSVSTSLNGPYSTSVTDTNYLDSTVNTVIYAKPDPGMHFIGCRFGSNDKFDGADYFTYTETVDGAGNTVYEISVPNDYNYQVSVQFGHKITYDSRGGSVIEPQYVPNGGKVQYSSDCPTREGGWSFMYWCADTDLTEEFDYTTPIYEDTTLYAKWSTGFCLGVYNQSDPDANSFLNPFGSVNIQTSDPSISYYDNMTTNYTLPEGPVTYTAVPAAGCKFVGWFEGVVGTSYFVEYPTGEALSTELTYTSRGEDVGNLCAVFAVSDNPGDTPGDNPGGNPTDTPAPISLAGANVSISPKTYNGKAQTAAVTVKLNNVELTKDTDYILSGDTQTNAGDHKVTVTGKGSYTGTASGTFTINKAEMTSPGDKKVAVGKTVSVKTTGGKVTYSTKDTAIATVNSTTGVVTGKSAGVAAITITDAGSANYKASTKTVKVTVSCAAPTIKKLQNVKGGIKLTISKPSGARKVEILCKSGSGAWKSVGYTTGTTYTAKTRDGKNPLKAGTKYSFTVRCVDKNNKKTVVSTYNKTGKAWVYAPVTSLSKVANSKAKTAKPTWKKAAGITGYEVQYSQSKSFASKNKSVKVKGTSKLTTSIGSLTKGKTYYFRVRTYVTSGGKTYPSAWSAAVKVKISK